MGVFPSFDAFLIGISIVIPGRREAANPESISPLPYAAQWIPGLRLRRIPE
jgi:hypothetical protein